MEYAWQGSNWASTPASQTPKTDVEPQQLSSHWLRLIRGDSATSVWMVPAHASDSSVSVGSASTCDWRLRGELPEVALHLRTLAGNLFVRANEGGNVLLDGQRLGAMWVPVFKGARISVGDTVIEVGLSGRTRSAQHRLLTTFFNAHAELREDDDIVHPPLLSVVHAESPERELASMLCAQSDAPALAFDTQAVAAEPNAAAIFDADEPRPTVLTTLPTGTGVWIAGSLLACAYGCFVILLDYI